jgi:hypothetical protein
MLVAESGQPSCGWAALQGFKDVFRCGVFGSSASAARFINRFAELAENYQPKDARGTY